MPEVVVHGVTGFAVHTYEELRDSLKGLAGLDPRRCRNHVAQSFSRDTMVSDYVKLYEEMGRGGWLKIKIALNPSSVRFGFCIGGRSS